MDRRDFLKTVGLSIPALYILPAIHASSPVIKSKRLAKQATPLYDRIFIPDGSLAEFSVSNFGKCIIGTYDVQAHGHTRRDSILNVEDQIEQSCRDVIIAAGFHGLRNHIITGKKQDVIRAFNRKFGDKYNVYHWQSSFNYVDTTSFLVVVKSNDDLVLPYREWMITFAEVYKPGYATYCNLGIGCLSNRYIHLGILRGETCS